MLKQLLIIFCIIGASFAQIQQGGFPNYFNSRIDDVNFIQIDKSNTVDRGFHSMVFQFGNEYDVDIDVLESASIINENDEITYLLGIESRGAYGIGLNFDRFFLTEGAELFIYDLEKTIFIGSFTNLNNKDKIFNKDNTLTAIGEKVKSKMLAPSAPKKSRINPLKKSTSENPKSRIK